MAGIKTVSRRTLVDTADDGCRSFDSPQVILHSERTRRGTPAQFAALVGAVGQGPGTLYVFSGSAMLYPETGRRPLSRYMLPSHLQIRRETGAIGVDQKAEIARILAARPDRVVVGDPYWPQDSVASYRAMRRGLAQGGYRRIAALPLGRDTVQVWARATS